MLFKSLRKQETVNVDGLPTIVVREMNAAQRFEYETEIQAYADDTTGFLLKASALLARSLYSETGEQYYSDDAGPEIAKEITADTLMPLFQKAVALNGLAAKDEFDSGN